MDREHIVTLYPALAHAAQRWTPMRPVPPMTEMVGNSLLGRSGGLGGHGPEEEADDDDDDDVDNNNFYLEPRMVCLVLEMMMDLSCGCECWVMLWELLW